MGLRRSIFITLWCLALFFGGCGTDDPLANQSDENQVQTDAGGEDPDAVNADVGDDVEGDPDEFRSPTLYHSASAGGSVEGDGYRMVIGVGAPVPRGRAAGGGYRIQFGPVSP